MSQKKNDSFQEFRARVLKISSPRNSKSTHTYVSKEIIRNIRKQYAKAKVVDEDTYSKIIRRINELLIEELFNTAKISLPYNMGDIALYSKDGKIYEDNGKLVRTMPVKWSESLKLWYTNPKALEKKVLIRDLPQRIYKIRHICKQVGFKNQQYYTFKPCRDLKLKLKKLLENNINVPAYEHGIYYN